MKMKIKFIFIYLWWASYLPARSINFFYTIRLLLKVCKQRPSTPSEMNGELLLNHFGWLFEWMMNGSWRLVVYFNIILQEFSSPIIINEWPIETLERLVSFDEMFSRFLKSSNALENYKVFLRDIYWHFCSKDRNAWEFENSTSSFERPPTRFTENLIIKRSASSPTIISKIIQNTFSV